MRHKKEFPGLRGEDLGAKKEIAKAAGDVGEGAGEVAGQSGEHQAPPAGSERPVDE